MKLIKSGKAEIGALHIGFDKSETQGSKRL